MQKPFTATNARSGAFRALLRHSVVRRQAVSGLLAQVTQGAASVGIILVVRAEAGSLALAGVVVSAVWIAGAIARPMQGRIIDSGRTRPLLTICAVVHPAALTGIVAISRVHGLSWLLVILAILAGLAMPPISTCMRTGWSGLVSLDERTGCYSLIYFVQELAVLVGPLLLAALIAGFSAAVALIVVASIAGGGTLAFATTTEAQLSRFSRTSRASGSPLRVSGVGVLLAIALLVGGVLGALQVAAATLATAHRAPAVAGLLIAALSVGGIVGALLYGARRWRGRPWQRLTLLLLSFATLLALTTTTSSLVITAGVMLFSGIALNPTLATFSLLLDQHIAGGAVAEAFGWLSTALASGTSGGSALTAAIAQRQHDPKAAFLTAALACAGAALLAVATRSILNRTCHLGTS